jgi:hypothetical protein
MVSCGNTILECKRLRGSVSQPTKRKSVPVLWMGMAFGVSLALAAVILANEGIDAKSLRMALRVTARWSFLFFWAAYAGKAMATLFGPVFLPLARRGREFGLAYAAAMLIHVGLVVWLYQLTSRAPLSGNSLRFFVLGIFWTYLLALFSFGRLVEAVGPMGWRILRLAGLNYILLAFASDFIPTVIGHGTGRYGTWRLVAYIPFAAMSVAAPLLVLAAAAHRHLEIRYHRTGLGPVVD